MPFGYWYRLHWRFLTPQYSRPISFNNSFAPQFQVGLKYWGRQAVGNSEWEYHAWVGDGPDQFGTNKRSVEDFGYGGSLFFNHEFGGTRDVTFGATLGVHTQSVATGEVTGNEENLVFGAELRMTGFELMGEYFHHELERAGDDPFLLEATEYSTWYLSALAWFTPSVGILYRYDFGDDPKTAKETLDPETTYHNVGLIYRPNARVQIRMEYNIREFKDPTLVEYNSWLAWWGIKF